MIWLLRGVIHASFIAYGFIYRVITIMLTTQHAFRSRSFVAKGGEEVRMDERLQTVFGVMNGLAAASPRAAARQLRAVTYEVIPFSNRLGLLEFVPVSGAAVESI